MSKIKGSAILIVIILAMAFIVYVTSTFYSEQHLELMTSKYENYMKSYYEKDLDNLTQVYKELELINRNK